MAERKKLLWLWVFTALLIAAVAIIDLLTANFNVSPIYALPLIMAMRVRRGLLHGDRRRRTHGRLLRPDDPAGDEAEQHAGDAEGDGVRFHREAVG